MKPEIFQRVIPNDQFALLMASLLDQGRPVRFTAKGGSMSPFIKDGDTLTVAPIVSRRISLGDVLAFNHPNRYDLMVHRVVLTKNGQYLMKADHGRHPDGWILTRDVIGILTAVQREGRKIDFGLGWEKRLIARLSRRNLLMLIIVFFWRLTPPFLKKKLH